MGFDDSNGDNLAFSNVRGSTLLQRLIPGQIIVQVDGDQKNTKQILRFTLTNDAGKIYRFDMNTAKVTDYDRYYCDKPSSWSLDNVPQMVVTCYVMTLDGPQPIMSGNDAVKTADIRKKGSTGLDDKPIDIYQMQACLKSIGDGRWHQGGYHKLTCGNLHWEVGGSSWSSASDCYNSCVNAVSKAINDGANNAYCDAYAGSAHCWVGFYLT